MIYAGGSNMNGVGVSNVYYGVQHITISGNSFQWYITAAILYNGNTYSLAAERQNNDYGKTYNYFAVGQ